jgi:uncharacterized protein YndB with AHSA1/START domain
MLKKIAIAVVVLVVVVVLALVAMPSDYSVERRITVAAPPEAVFEQIDVAKAWPDWMIWYEREPDMTKTFAGPERGVGAEITFTGNDGTGTYTLTKSDPAKGIEYTLAFVGTAPAAGTIEMNKTDKGTEVVWTLAGEMDGLAGKMFVPMMDSMVGADFQEGLAKLKRLVETKK